MKIRLLAIVALCLLALAAVQARDSIRKGIQQNLSSYVAGGVMSKCQANEIRTAINAGWIESIIVQKGVRGVNNYIRKRDGAASRVPGIYTLPYDRRARLVCKKYIFLSDCDNYFQPLEKPSPPPPCTPPPPPCAPPAPKVTFTPPPDAPCHVEVERVPPCIAQVEVEKKPEICIRQNPVIVANVAQSVGNRVWLATQGWFMYGHGSSTSQSIQTNSCPPQQGPPQPTPGSDCVLPPGVPNPPQPLPGLFF